MDDPLARHLCPGRLGLAVIWMSTTQTLSNIPFSLLTHCGQYSDIIDEYSVMHYQFLAAILGQKSELE